MGSLLGGNSSQSSSGSSYNAAFPALSAALAPNVSTGTGAVSSLAGLLGIGGNSAQQQAAFDTFKNNTGYNAVVNAGTNAILGNAASRGLLNSGATGKALTNYGQQMGQQYVGNFMNQLLGLGQLGNASAGIIGGTGTRSNTTSGGSSKQGLGF